MYHAITEVKTNSKIALTYSILKKSWLSTSLWAGLMLFSFSMTAQIIQGKDTLYGNEWIKSDQTYLKFFTDKDGLYQITFEDLTKAGVPLASIRGSQLQVWRLGVERPLWISNAGIWTAGDNLKFWGYKNRSELDAPLFSNAPLEMLNPAYSLVTDSSAYFLTWVPNGMPTKRINLKSSNNQVAISPFLMVDQFYEFHTNPLDKRYDSGNEIAFSSFDECEGFATRLNREYAQTLKLKDAFEGKVDGKLSIRLGTGNQQHLIKISINDETIKLDTFFGFRVRVYDFVLSNDLLQKDIRLKIESIGPGSDQFAVANIHLIYPKTAGGTLGSQESLMPAATIIMSRISGTNNQSILIDPAGSDWYQSTTVNGEHYVEIPASGSRDLYTLELADATTISKLIPTKFEPIAEDPKANYIIITHKKLMTSAQEYAAYRRSAPGGSYAVTVVDIDQIYDQFGYGQSRHVIGLKNFGQYIHRHWSAPEYIFLIGRSLNYRDRRIDNNFNEYAHLDLVPSFGYPGSDNLTFAAPGKNLPVFSIARLAATSPDQVSNYLKKVKEYESKLKSPGSNDDLYWRKKILHLAGGSPTDGFDRLLDGFKSAIQGSLMNPEVFSVKKTSSDPIQGGVSEIVKNLINEGVVVHSYLGHGAISATEVGLDDPEIFDNVGKYPICFTLGCNSGNMHTTGVSLSESFIFSSKGDIVYIASSGIGTDGDYGNYGKRLYGHMGSDYYNQTISSLHFQALRELATSSSFTVQALTQQLSIQGDPAIQLNYHTGPDYTLDTKSFKTIPQNVQADQDSLRFSFTLWNLGRYNSEVIPFEVSHTLPDGKVLTYRFQEKLEQAYKEVFIALPMPENVIGNNTLNIKIDPDNIFNELPQPFAENNNELKINGTTGIIVGIFNNEVTPAYPQDYGIVGSSPITLKAFTSNALGNPDNYIFELDTTALFNSAFLQKINTKQRGGLITWSPTFNAQAGTVYYWRVAADTVGTGRPVLWSQRSFIYLPGQGPGWNQSHGYQYAENKPNQTLNFNLDANQWQLATQPTSFVASSINSILDPSEYSKVLINGERYTRNNGNFQSEFILTIWDPKVGLVRNPVGGRDGATNVFSIPAPGYYFPMDKNTSEERGNLMRFMNEGIQDGQYVIVINHIQPGASYFPEFWAMDSLSLGKNLYQVFEQNGATLIRNLIGDNYSYPYVFVYQKGKKIIDEGISSNGLEIRSAFELPLIRQSGMHESPLIGPASSWEKFEWLHQDGRNKEDNEISIQGLNGDHLDTLYRGRATNFDLTKVNASTYPYLKLNWLANDSLRTGSIHMDYWRIHFKRWADLAIASNDEFEFFKDSIDQGDPSRLKFTIQNIGDQPIDSSMVIYTITDEQNRSHKDTTYNTLLSPGAKKTLTKEISTEGRVRDQSILVNLINLTALPEITLRNNAGQINYVVVTDLTPPTVTVFFDGTQIINNEIVSKQPLILIDLKDNKAWTGTDTSAVTISLKLPGTDKFVPVSLKEYTIDVNKNELSVQYHPQFTLNGLYTLRVQGNDRSGNPAATAAYEISFKVITENSVSSILPYPNPFSTQCRFAYTLTGEAPTVFKIQVMTVSGRVVRELTEMDLGPLREGTHLTEGYWDGHDEYGNILANGTYLYRVILKDLNGKTYSSFEALDDAEGKDARRFFTKGIGKLVILR